MSVRYNMPLTDSFLDGALGAFLRTRGVESGGASSVTGMGHIKGKWMVKDEDYSQFLDLLHEYLFVQQRRPLNLVEQRRCDLYSPILIDLDFKYPPESAIQRRFNIINIKTFIRNYVKQMNYYYDLSQHENIRFFISLRPTPYEDKKGVRSIKDGVHIECPDLILHADHIRLLRDKALENGCIKGGFEGTGYMNPEKDIFDELKKQGWFFYGESKPDIPAYSLSSIYVYDPQDDEFTEEDPASYTSRDLIDILSIRHNLKKEALTIKHDVQEEMNERLRKLTNVVEEKGCDTVDTFPTWFTQGYSESEITLAKSLAIKCLNDKRADAYSSWMEVGWCLYNIEPSEEMFNIWVEFSAKSSKFNSSVVNSMRKEWNSMSKRGDEKGKIKIGSLHMWAKEDNLEEYNEIMNEDHINFIITHVDATHTHVARLIQRLYWDKYRCAVNKKETEWFEFDGSSWKGLDQGIEILNKMSNEVAELISQARSTLRKRVFKAESNDKKYEEDYVNEAFKRLMKIEKSLYTNGFKGSVMKECVGLFYEKDFFMKLNADPYLLGVSNGVVNLRAERTKPDGSIEYYVEHREGRPEDFITYNAGRWEAKMCDPIPYEQYDPSDPDQDEIDDFMEKLFPNKDLRDYMWRKMASCLDGENRDQKFDVWIGIGGNGKSKLQDLMYITLGDYAVNIESTVLTRKRPESGNANPDLEVLLNKRFISTTEPDEGEPLNVSRMKQMVGGDAIAFRKLFGNQQRMVIGGKIFLLCNKYPAVNSQDRGTWRRINAIGFASKFVDPHSEEGKEINPEKNIYPRDITLDSKLKKWRTAFLSRLIYIYDKEYRHQGLEPIPACISQESDKYRSQFDSFGKFKMSRIRLETGYEANIRDIWRVYRNWHEVSGNSGKRMTQTDLQNRLDLEFGEAADKKTYKRLRLFDTDEDIDEYDAEIAAAGRK
jgi:P4 family phage/plasmid primase-like protien